MLSRFFRSLSVLIILVLAGPALTQTPSISRFEWATIEAASGERLGGRVFLVFSKRPIGAGVFSQHWFTPEPFFAQANSSGHSIVFRPDASFPRDFPPLPKGTYHVQAILDRDHGDANPLAAAGNRFSKTITMEIDPKQSPKPTTFVLDQTVPAKTFTPTDRVRLFEMESPRLTAFHGRPMKLRAGVVLPKSAASVAKAPIVYEIPGFGGTHHLAFAAEKRKAADVAGIDAIHVVLDPACRRGHHVFANSANNGPVGDALVQEFLPALEAAFGGIREPKHRILTGHSSGGWSSLWLQIAYPDFFGGVWSTAPDSVDFRDFQLVDLYAKNANLFIDPAGNPRPIARKEGKVVLTTRKFSDMEVVMGRGGQLFSFEAVFSPRGPDGEPRQLWNRTTGAIDPVVAESWRKYDIRHHLETHWPTLGPRLKGKIHVFMGADDTFYLDGATRLLKESLERLGSDAVVEIVPGRHHGNLVDPVLRQRIAREMAKQWQTTP